MLNLRIHPQPLLLKREGAKIFSFPSFFQVPLLLREGFRVSLLFFYIGFKTHGNSGRLMIEKSELPRNFSRGLMKT